MCEALSAVASQTDPFDLQHKSSTANFKTSRRKLNDLSRLIAGLGADEAILQLKVSTSALAGAIVRSWPSSERSAARVGGLEEAALVSLCCCGTAVGRSSRAL